MKTSINASLPQTFKVRHLGHKAKDSLMGLKKKKNFLLMERFKNLSLK